MIRRLEGLNVSVVGTEPAGKIHIYNGTHHAWGAMVHTFLYSHPNYSTRDRILPRENDEVRATGDVVWCSHRQPTGLARTPSAMTSKKYIYIKYIYEYMFSAFDVAIWGSG